MAVVYDPLDYENLAGSVVRTLLEQEVSPLPPSLSFDGAGAYAIYYQGSLPFYASLSSPSSDRPIYVGKAIPAGARKGRRSKQPGMDRALYQRLRQHAASVDQAQNLDPAEFRCRYLVVVPVWISLAERSLIEHFQPLWNTIIDGFGNHAPGRGRSNMRRPRWDILHPGRPWAQDLSAEETQVQVAALIPSR